MDRSPILSLKRTRSNEVRWATQMISTSRRVTSTDGVELVHVTDEDEYFPPPRELRELIPADDRTISAAEVLADLVRASE